MPKQLKNIKRNGSAINVPPIRLRLRECLCILEKKLGIRSKGSLERSQFDRLFQAITNLQNEIDDDLN